jgi:hypothetical protein
MLSRKQKGAEEKSGHGATGLCGWLNDSWRRPKFWAGVLALANPSYRGVDGSENHEVAGIQHALRVHGSISRTILPNVIRPDLIEILRRDWQEKKRRVGRLGPQGRPSHGSFTWPLGTNCRAMA